MSESISFQSNRGGNPAKVIRMVESYRSGLIKQSRNPTVMNVNSHIAAFDLIKRGYESVAAEMGLDTSFLKDDTTPPARGRRKRSL